MTAKEPNVQKLDRVRRYYSGSHRSLEGVRIDLSNIKNKLLDIEKAKSDAKRRPDELAPLERQALDLEQKRAELLTRESELDIRIKSAIAVRTAAEEWLNARGIAIPRENIAAHYNGPVPDIDEGSAQTLQDLRGKIADLKSKAQVVERAWPPAKLLIAEKHAQIDKLLHPICMPGVDISKRRSADDLWLLTIACNAPQLKKAIAARIEEITPEGALSPEDKASQLQAIAHEILELELQEETLCVELEERHVAVVRRKDLNPEVFLETVVAAERTGFSATV